jgi:hypothetical protein
MAHLRFDLTGTHASAFALLSEASVQDGIAVFSAVGQKVD